MAPEIALVTRGVEYAVLGLGYDSLPEAQRAAVVAAHPRPNFKPQILATFTEGLVDRPATTFGNVKSDVLRHYHPGFHPTDFVELIQTSPLAGVITPRTGRIDLLPAAPPLTGRQPRRPSGGHLLFFGGSVASDT